LSASSPSALDEVVIASEEESSDAGVGAAAGAGAGAVNIAPRVKSPVGAGVVVVVDALVVVTTGAPAAKPPVVIIVEDTAGCANENAVEVMAVPLVPLHVAPPLALPLNLAHSVNPLGLSAWIPNGTFITLGFSFGQAVEGILPSLCVRTSPLGLGLRIFVSCIFCIFIFIDVGDRTSYFTYNGGCDFGVDSSVAVTFTSLIGNHVWIIYNFVAAKC
jgi:hypothetical protein